jgi:hypothetical protein
MIRNNIDVLAMVLVLLTVAIVSGAHTAALRSQAVTRTIALRPDTGCRIVKAVTLLPVFR